MSACSRIRMNMLRITCRVLPSRVREGPWTKTSADVGLRTSRMRKFCYRVLRGLNPVRDDHSTVHFSLTNLSNSHCTEGLAELLRKSSVRASSEGGSAAFPRVPLLITPLFRQLALAPTEQLFVNPDRYASHTKLGCGARTIRTAFFAGRFG